MIDLLKRALPAAVLICAAALPAVAQPMNPVSAADIERALGYVPASASATINSGAAGKIGYYADTGTEISEAAKLSATTGGLGIASGTQTTSQPVLAATQTWNDDAVAFNGITLDVTNTASAATSRLISLALGGARQFSVGRNGVIGFRAVDYAIGAYGGASNIVAFLGSNNDMSGAKYLMTSDDIRAPANNCFNWSDDANTAAAAIQSGLCSPANGIIEFKGATAGSGAVARFNAITAPGTPAAGKVYLYVDVADGVLKSKDDAGNVKVLSGL
ncbi:hypothetical protein [Reyranella sp.]|uniref:hypothetical protein n=1 Tax=Reyranella sp. TaxID=1929291 RepID=UPI0027310F4D|nr:hypothetical protein [Reyranella sp.]MDP2377796.1 hypothetical protein [Reyranella sp.]